jgi:pyruvate/2-oxoglutarate dehydrogenase complex dihydrolipoamide acyltransferase (E2) component
VPQLVGTRAAALARTASTLREPLRQAADAFTILLVRKLADEHRVDLTSIKGTGVGGRVRQQDVIAAARANTATSKRVDRSETPSPKTSGQDIVGWDCCVGG